ncbi:MAG: biliverdin-producing heme oxygenase [Myxococcaceae bacterium]|nr:biliverdin-producing heme oxygenase [Myxococcaceae bacterium]
MERPQGGFAQRLRQGTAAAHRHAESGAFVKGLMDGTVSRAVYGRFVHGLHTVYQSLERGLRTHRDDPRVGPLVFAEVERVGALAADAAFYGVEPGAAPLLEARTYGQHLDELTATAPHRLVAHAYTRTLGDLSGGQMLRRCLERAFGLTGSGGVAFYVFEQLADVDAFKHRYRATLDALPLSGQEQADVVEEAVRAFELNAAIMRALG